MDCNAEEKSKRKALKEHATTVLTWMEQIREFLGRNTDPLFALIIREGIHDRPFDRPYYQRHVGSVRIINDRMTDLLTDPIINYRRTWW